MCGVIISHYECRQHAQLNVINNKCSMRTYNQRDLSGKPIPLWCVWIYIKETLIATACVDVSCTSDD